MVKGMLNDILSKFLIILNVMNFKSFYFPTNPLKIQKIQLFFSILRLYQQQVLLTFHPPSLETVHMLKNTHSLGLSYHQMKKISKKQLEPSVTMFLIRHFNSMSNFCKIKKMFGNFPT